MSPTGAWPCLGHPPPGMEASLRNLLGIMVTDGSDSDPADLHTLPAYKADFSVLSLISASGLLESPHPRKAMA